MKRIFITTIVIVFMTSCLFAQQQKGVKDANGLAVGAIAPEFSAVDSHNNKFTLSEKLKQGPVVVIFYRGNWCPVCTQHLGKVQDSLDIITKTGATVVAVSPERPENSEKMQEKTGAKFALLYDEGYKISEAFDVDFNPTKVEKFKYNKFLKADLVEAHSDDSERLPIPATFILNKDGKVIWRHFNPNYKKRASVKSIFMALAQLKR